MTEYLCDIVHKYAQVKVLVVGDAIIDLYHFGRVDRISPEAPVPIFVEDYAKSDHRRGGADNVAHQLEVLGCTVYESFSPRRSVKHRYMVGNHQLFRRDSDGDLEPTPTDTVNACKLAKECDVIVLSDYAKGWLSPMMCRELGFTGKKIVVDPKGQNWSKYKNATVICPNSKELEIINGYDPNCRIVEKRGPRGLMIHNNPPPHDSIAATAKKVFDVTGAGDTVTALIAASIATGASLHDAAVIANYAAGVVVGKVGTSVCTKEELLSCVSGLQTVASISSTKATGTS